MGSSERTRTLLVDPDPERRAQLERLLQAAGHDVVAMGDPAGAPRPTEAGGPELVLLAMPAEPGVALAGLSRAFQPRAPDQGPRGGRGRASGRPTLGELERRYALEILRETGGNKTRAAEILGIDRKTLYRLIDDARSNGVAPEPLPPHTS